MTLKVHHVLAPNPGYMTGAGTNTYLIEDGAGGVVVVDPGPDDERHVAAILAAAQPLGEIKAMLVTHGHLDHLPAATALGKQTGAKLHGHALLPGVERPLAEGETWRSGSLSLTALATPGHTDDSLCYWFPDERVLFTGDLIAGAGTVVVGESRCSEVM